MMATEAYRSALSYPLPEHPLSFEHGDDLLRDDMKAAYDTIKILISQVEALKARLAGAGIP